MFMWTLKRLTIIQSRIKDITGHILAEVYHVCVSVTSLQTLNLHSSEERGVAMETLKVSSEGLIRRDACTFSHLTD